MPLLAAIPLIMLASLAGICAAYYAVVWWRITQVSRQLPTLRAGLGEGASLIPDSRPATPASSSAPRPPRPPRPSRPPRVAIIIPAHNERDVIERLAISLCRLECDHFRAVFVLDRCTDDTEALLRNALDAHAIDSDHRERFEIIVNTHCPEGWTGKNHAAHRGVRDSVAAQHADFFCFIDADTAFEPRGLTAALNLMERNGLDLLSLLSTLDIAAWYERVVQPAAGVELIRQFPLDLVNRPDSNRAFANGQFLLFRRGAYEAVGRGPPSGRAGVGEAVGEGRDEAEGEDETRDEVALPPESTGNSSVSLGAHERVRHELLEDLAFARKIKWFHKDLRLGVVLADGLFRCRMYRSWPAFVRGWKRIYTEAARRRPARLRTNAWRLRAVGTALPLCTAIAFVTGPIVMKLGDMPLGAALLITGALGVYAFAGAVARALRAQHAPAWLMVLYPVGAWLTARIMSSAASDLVEGQHTQWAGKTYHRTIRP
ncbi:MAG: glycosyltransferase [Phycisphaerales bacterium]